MKYHHYHHYVLLQNFIHPQYYMPSFAQPTDIRTYLDTYVQLNSDETGMDMTIQRPVEQNELMLRCMLWTELSVKNSNLLSSLFFFSP